MLSGIAAFFGLAPETVRDRLLKLGKEPLFELFSHGVLARQAFVEQMTALLGTPDFEPQLIDLFEEAHDRFTGTLSYAQLRHVLDRPAAAERSTSPNSPIPRSGRGLPGDIFAGSGGRDDPERIDRQAFRLAMLRVGLKATPAEIDGLFDMIDAHGTGTVRRADLLTLLRSKHMDGVGGGGVGGGAPTPMSAPRRVASARSTGAAALTPSRI